VIYLTIRKGKSNSVSLKKLKKKEPLRIKKIGWMRKKFLEEKKKKEKGKFDPFEGTKKF